MDDEKYIGHPVRFYRVIGNEYDKSESLEGPYAAIVTRAYDGLFGLKVFMRFGDHFMGDVRKGQEKDVTQWKNFNRGEGFWLPLVE